MNRSVKVHSAAKSKYAAWLESHPGKPEDSSMLLRAYLEDFGKIAIEHAKRNQLDSQPFELEGASSQWFLVAVRKLSRSNYEVVILDLIDPPVDRSAR